MHPKVKKSITDTRFQGRFNRYFLPHTLMFVPGFIFASEIYREFGRMPLRAVGTAALAYLAVVLLLNRFARKEALVDLRREVDANVDYEPPAF